MVRKYFYIGLDVHKRTTYYAVRDWDGKTVIEGECASTFRDLWSILEPYTSCCKITLEASTYFYFIYDEFKKRNVEIIVANTLQLRKLVGKNDRLDAARLSDMLRLTTIPESFIPGKVVQYLRSLCLLRYNCVGECTRLKNQIHAYLDSKGVRIPVRTPFSKKWCNHLCDYINENNPFELNYLYQAEQQSEKRLLILDKEISSYVEENFSDTSELLMSIPGIGQIWSAFIIAQVGTISRFSDKRKLRRYAGVVPVRDESAHKSKKEYLPKMSSRKLLRLALVQAAHSAVKVKGNLQEYYKKKKRQKQFTQQAIMCVASSLSDILYHVLSLSLIHI